VAQPSAGGLAAAAPWGSPRPRRRRGRARSAGSSTTRAKGGAAKADKPRARKASDKTETLGLLQAPRGRLGPAAPRASLQGHQPAQSVRSLRHRPVPAPQAQLRPRKPPRLYLKPSYGLHSTVTRGGASGEQPGFGFNSSPGFEGCQQGNDDGDDGAGKLRLGPRTPPRLHLRCCVRRRALVLKPKQVGTPWVPTPLGASRVESCSGDTARVARCAKEGAESLPLDDLTACA